eukprot:scaffold111_cov156-Isochrysis_galbana.AAC.1
MEQTPADARAAPSVSVPNDVDMGIASSLVAKALERAEVRDDVARHCHCMIHGCAIHGRVVALVAAGAGARRRLWPWPLASAALLEAWGRD